MKLLQMVDNKYKLLKSYVNYNIDKNKEQIEKDIENMSIEEQKIYAQKLITSFI